MLLGDAVMAALCARHGPARLSRRRPFPALVGAIVSQQISGKAAASIAARLRTLYPITAAALATAHPMRLRSAGLSRAKARYIRELAKFARAGGLKGLSKLSDDAIVARLTEVNGIGVWTAEMFLMFSLGRTDVWPVLDGGVQRAARQLYSCTTREELTELGERFRPFRSHAAWYLWRSLDVPVAAAGEEG
ncbi:MAG: DNA-3-methyladenine glycosylase 2 family protein [Gemmatimonadota bacterium]